jgi:hypothetical protein
MYFGLTSIFALDMKDDSSTEWRKPSARRKYSSVDEDSRVDNLGDLT